jgi:flavorubredoxin
MSNATLPREIIKNIFWLGDCLEQRSKGKIYHSYNSAYLVIGNQSALLIETGHPKDFKKLDEQIKSILVKKNIPLKYLFITHQETPHAGGVGRFLNLYPELTVHGDVSDYHMAFPDHAKSFIAMEVGDSIDLGGIEFEALEPVVRDLRTSLWGCIKPMNLLFPGDGFAYSHYHEDGHCGMIAEEAKTLDLFDVSAVFAELALFWTNFVDMDIYADELRALIIEKDIKAIAPTHGLPILNIPKTMPKVLEGLSAPYKKIA